MTLPKMMRLLGLLLALGMSGVLAVDPGVKGRLTLKGLQYGWQLGTQELQQRLDTIQIPDVGGVVSVPVLGNIFYQVTQLQVKSFDLSNSNLSFIPDNGVTVLIQEGQVQIKGYLHINTFLFSAGSWLVVQVQGLALSAALGITCDDLGHSLVWDGGCSSGVGQVDMWFEGGAGWFLDLFRGSMIGPIRDSLSTQICPAFEQAVIQIEKELSTLPVSLLVDSVASVELDLVGPPLITGESFDLLVKGQFVGHTERWDFPQPPEKLLIPDVESRMLLLALSQFSINSAAFVHYKAGFLTLNITDDMVPKLSPIRLNARSLGMFAPELPSRYPDSPPVMLRVSARVPPAVTCDTDSLTLQATADIEAFITEPDRPPIPIFQLQADSVTGVDLLLSEEAAGATISIRNFSLSLVHSDVGPVKISWTIMVEALQSTLNLALKVLLPAVNERLRNIAPLPTDVLRLQDPVIRVMKGYVLIMTDLATPSHPSTNQNEWRDPRQ